MLELAQIPVAPATQEQTSWRHSLVGLSAGAGAIHLYAIPEHLKEYWPFAAFFAGVAAFQAAWALAVLARPQRGLYGIGAVASAGLITLWALSRTSGLPLGREPWHPEAASLPDVLAVALESGLILTIRARRGSRHPKPRTQPRRRRWTSHRARHRCGDTSALAPELTQRVPHTEEGRRLCARNAVARRPAPHPHQLTGSSRSRSAVPPPPVGRPTSQPPTSHSGRRSAKPVSGCQHVVPERPSSRRGHVGSSRETLHEPSTALRASAGATCGARRTR